MKTKLLICCMLVLMYGFSRADAGMTLITPLPEDILLAKTSPSFVATFQIGDAISYGGWGGGTEPGMILSGTDAETKYCQPYYANYFTFATLFTFIAKPSGFEIKIGGITGVLDFLPTLSTDKLLLYINAEFPDTRIDVNDLQFGALSVPNMSSLNGNGYVWEITGISNFGQSESGDIISERIQMFKTGSYVPIDDDLVFRIIGIGDGSPYVPEPGTLIVMIIGFVLQRAYRGPRKNSGPLFYLLFVLW